MLRRRGNTGHRDNDNFNASVRVARVARVAAGHRVESNRVASSAFASICVRETRCTRRHFERNECPTDHIISHHITANHFASREVHRDKRKELLISHYERNYFSMQLEKRISGAFIAPNNNKCIYNRKMQAHRVTYFTHSRTHTHIRSLTQLIIFIFNKPRALHIFFPKILLKRYSHRPARPLSN